jgi:hypothetical protein
MVLELRSIEGLLKLTPEAPTESHREMKGGSSEQPEPNGRPELSSILHFCSVTFSFSDIHPTSADQRTTGSSIAQSARWGGVKQS